MHNLVSVEVMAGWNELGCEEK